MNPTLKTDLLKLKENLNIHDHQDLEIYSDALLSHPQNPNQTPITLEYEEHTFWSITHYI